MFYSSDSKIKGLGAIGTVKQHETDSDSEDDNNYYTGGEKSGLAVEKQPKDKTHESLIKKIIKQAQ